jgi:hypothetical protein
MRARYATGGIGESEPIHTRPSDPRASHTPADMQTNGWGCSDEGATYPSRPAPPISGMFEERLRS